jgi:hypothetical protein
LGLRFSPQTAAEIPFGIVEGPTPDEGSAQCERVPRLRLNSPLRHAIAMLPLVVIDPSRKGLQQETKVFGQRGISEPANLRVSPHTLFEIHLCESPSEDFRQPTFRKPVPHHELRDPVFGLDVAQSVGCGFLG